MNRVRGAISWPLKGEGHLAHHEAGHLVVASLLGMSTGAAVVVPGKGGAAAVGMGTHPAPKLPSPIDAAECPPAKFGLVCLMLDASWPECWPGKTKEQAALDYATMLAAGRQAELIRADFVLKPDQLLRLNDDDHRQMLEILLHVGFMRTAIGWCQHRARVLLLEHWEQVETIAAELLEGAAHG